MLGADEFGIYVLREWEILGGRKTKDTEKTYRQPASHCYSPCVPPRVGSFAPNLSVFSYDLPKVK